MTRRRFYAPPETFALADKSVTLSADEARHARNVLRLQPGDELYVFDGEGKEFRCAVREFAHRNAVLDVLEAAAPARPESPLELTLAIGLLKHDKFDLVIMKATELGVTRLIPVESERADVRLKYESVPPASAGGSVKDRLTRWRRIAIEAAKQSGRARIPEISAQRSFESLVNESFAEDTLRVIFSEREGTSLSATVAELHTQSVVALVGPEGGWTAEEIETARENDWKIVTLGGRTLRAETAAIAVVALLQHRFGDLD